MVRHTNKRRNSRRRRQTRGRRTQKGGFSFFGFGGDSINDLREKLNKEKNPEKQADIQKKINIETENQRHEKTLQEIEKGSTTESNMGDQEYGNQDYGNQEYRNQYYGNQDSRKSGYSGNPRELDGTRQFGDNNNNARNTWQRGGSRRRRRRHIRK
jgi:hypothetical protein